MIEMKQILLLWYKTKNIVELKRTAILVNKLDEATNKISQTEKNNFEWFQSITECHRHFKEELTNIRISQTLIERELKTVMARINENFINSAVSQTLLERELKTVVTQNSRSICTICTIPPHYLH